MNMLSKTRRIIDRITLCMVVCLTLVLFSTASQAHNHRHLRHVPDVVKEGNVQFTGEVPEEKTMFVSMILPTQNEEEMDRLLAEIYDPQSPNYHHYLTPEEATERFSPSQEDYNKV